MTAVEAILPTLATKADMERGQKETRAWMVATVLGMVVAIASLGGFYASRIDRAVERATERSLNAERTAERAAAAVERILERLDRPDRTNP